MFYPAAVYQKVSLVSAVGKEKLFSSFKVLVEEGYLKVANVPSGKKEEDAKNAFAPRCKRGFCFFIFPVAK